MSVDYIPPLPQSVLDSGTYSGVKIPQGAVITPGVLDVVFMDTEGNYVSPSEITYDVLAIDDAGAEHLIGKEGRTPVSVRTGRFSPNLQVGNKWLTGQYVLNWKYRVNSLDDISTRRISFEVVSSGIYDVRMVGLGLFNMKATVFVVE